MDTLNGNKTSSQLEEEVTAQRDRIEARIGEIKDRLSPGQLLDEALSYTKHGGAQFASNFAHQVSANPMPAALVGIGLAWLISSTASAGTATRDVDRREEDGDYPYARVGASGLRRVTHQADEEGQWWSEFEGDAGIRFKAKSDELGRRAGHFTDSTGRKFAGCIDEAGNRVRQFQDESGNRLDDAMGWAAHSWRDTKHSLGGVLSSATSAIGQTSGDVVAGSRKLGSSASAGVQAQADQLSRQIGSLFEQQPLIAGALAFAAGAALGAALPHTDQEDQLAGGQADKLRDKASESLGGLYDKGKERAAKVYEDVGDKASQVYDETKSRITSIAAAEGETTRQ
jgi:hypothetical protein